MEPPAIEKQLLEAISDLGLAVVVVQGERLLYVNEAAATLGGMTPAEAMARPSFMEFLAPEGRAAMQGAMRDLVAGDTGSGREVRVVLKDGRTLDLEVAIKPLPGPGTFVALYRDVTARKTEEARARHTEKLAAVGKLLAGVAHDINTPLATVLSNMEVTREEIDRALGSQVPLTIERLAALAARLEMNRAHLRRVATSIRRLQGLGSPQAPRRVPTDLRPFLLSATTVVRLGSHDRCEVEVDLPELEKVACDGDVVSHAVQNLLSNAVEAARSRVRFRARTEGGMFEAVVEDDGPGFAPGDLERAFEPFFTTKPPGNMGLGLTLARAIAQDHGGSLTAANVPGGGARLTFRIPQGVA